MVKQIFCCLLLIATAQAASAQEVRIKELGRFMGWRDNMLMGYGLVTGLSGSGDSPRSRATRQALSNVLSQFDLNVTQDDVNSRNVAIVMVSAILPPTADRGDKIDINVSSMGDARSLAGGTLLMTSLRGPDKRIYALSQGPISVGGYRYDANGNLQQKNHPTAGIVPEGATIEVPVQAELEARNGYLRFVLKNPDSNTAERIAQRINATLGSDASYSTDARTVYVKAPTSANTLNHQVAVIEDLAVTPDRHARVVINERTGTVVAGGDVQISSVSVAQGDIKVTVSTEYSASQPSIIGSAGPQVRSLLVGNSKLDVDDNANNVVATFDNTTVADLVQSLSKLHVSTRDTIAILQAVKAAGALYADLIIQ